MNKINGSGVMVFICRPPDNFVYLVQNVRRSGVYLEDTGGRLEANLTTMQNAIKELFEESFASISQGKLTEESAIIVNNEYKCYPLYIQVDDLKQFHNVVEMNRKILKGTQLRCFNEGIGIHLMDLKALLQSEMQYCMINENKVKIHKRAQSALKVLLNNGQIRSDGKVNLECHQCILKKLNYPKELDKLHLMHNQLTYHVQ